MRSVGGRLATVIVRFAALRTSGHRGLAPAHRGQTPFRRLRVADNRLRMQRTVRNRRAPHGPPRREPPRSFARAARRGTADQQHARRACRRGRQRERDGCQPQNRQPEGALEVAAGGDREDRRSASCRFARPAFPTRRPSSSRTRQALAGLAAGAEDLPEREHDRRSRGSTSGRGLGGRVPSANRPAVQIAPPPISGSGTGRRASLGEVRADARISATAGSGAARCRTHQGRRDRAVHRVPQRCRRAQGRRPRSERSRPSTNRSSLGDHSSRGEQQ
jgi:hypothetical protein